MSYLGNTPEKNIVYYVLGIDKFSGTSSCTQFSLSRTLAQDIDAQVIVNNVLQEPVGAYSVSGATLTFTEAPSSGSNNIQVIYRTQNVVAYSQLQSSEIQNEAITVAKLAASSVTETKIATGAVTESKIAANSVTSSALIDNAVQANNISTGSVIESKIATSAVTNSKIATGAVTSSKIGDGAVGTTQLATGLSVNITGGSISGITDLSIADGGTGASDATNARINLGTVSDPGSNGLMARTSSGSTTARTITGSTGITVSNGDGVSGNPTVAVSSGGITATQLASDSVETLKIKNANITAAKLNGAQSGSAPIFGVRAWVKFSIVTGVVTFNAGGNISSGGIVRNSTGNYTITFDTPMSDEHYAISHALDWSSAQVTTLQIVSQTASSFNIKVGRGDNPPAASDPNSVQLTIIR